uniref:Ig-like domain-containing protein n=1 Tax=Fundulus heteroclitus TaxID=8078 RepID=A0A3Q2PEX1_FUNHE
MFLTEHFAFRLQVYWWFLESLKVEWEADPLAIRLLSSKVGTAVSLPCTYAAWKYGRLPFCWARESTSAFGCNNQVIQSDGTKVLSSLSWRYSLAGNLATGDASLRISQVQESDSGKYICRVEIPGWFNDQKTENTLYVFPVLHLMVAESLHITR